MMNDDADLQCSVDFVVLYFAHDSLVYCRRQSFKSVFLGKYIFRIGKNANGLPKNLYGYTEYTHKCIQQARQAMQCTQQHTFYLRDIITRKKENPK